MDALKGLIRYVAGTIDTSLLFSTNQPGIVTYCDADFAGDLRSRKSTSGFCTLMYGACIMWGSKAQASVASSTVEAEYLAASLVAKECLWLAKLLSALGVSCTPLQIKCDSTGALRQIERSTTARTKHIDVIHHFVRDRVALGHLSFSYCKSADMLADLLTKSLPIVQHQLLSQKLGLVP
jgi:hypothetical protein